MESNKCQTIDISESDENPDEDYLFFLDFNQNHKLNEEDIYEVQEKVSSEKDRSEGKYMLK